MGLRGGEWRRQLLEEHFHEAAGTSYTDVQESGFEVLPDDMVIKSFLNHATGGDITEAFQITPFSVSYCTSISHYCSHNALYSLGTA